MFFNRKNDGHAVAIEELKNGPHGRVVWEEFFDFRREVFFDLPTGRVLLRAEFLRLQKGRAAERATRYTNGQKKWSVGRILPKGHLF